MDEKFYNDKMLDDVCEATVVYDRSADRVVYLNQRARLLFNLNGLDLKEIGIRHFCNRADLFNASAAMELFSSLEENVPSRFDWPVRLGVTKWLSVFINRFKYNCRDCVLMSFRDNTSEKESLMKLNKMVAFRDILNHILSYNTTVVPSEIPSLIDSTLAKVGHFFNCDRCYVFEYSIDRRFHSNINEWCAYGVDPYVNDLQNIPTGKFAYLSRKLFNKEIVCLNSVSDLPDDAKNEREEFAKEGIQSILLIPFVEGHEVIGFFGLDHVRISKIWTGIEVSNLQLLARTFANMLLRSQKDSVIQEQKRMYRTWFMAANDSIAIFNNGTCIDANPKLLSDLGCSREYLLGKSLVELSATIQPNGRSAAYINVFHQKALKGKPQFFEWFLRKANGDEINVEISLNSYTEKRQSHAIAIFRNVMENKAVVKKILAEDGSLNSRPLGNDDFTNDELSLLQLFDIEQLQNLQDAFSNATGVSSLITDIDGTPITEMSMTNKICQEVRLMRNGQKLCMLNHSRMSELAREDMNPVTSPCLTCEFMNAASPIIVDEKHLGNWIIGQVRPDGLSLQDLLNKTRTIGLDDNAVISQFEEVVKMDPGDFGKILELLHVLTKELSLLGFNNLKLARSLHEYIGLEKKLRLAKQNAEESDRLKSSFLANLSHEIRTPMNGIVGFSELLLHEGLTPDDRKDYVRMLNQSSRQLLNIINDIIDISKIESGQIEVHAGFFDLNRVFLAFEKLYAHLVEEKGLSLKFTNREADELEVFSDETKLRQVMGNLIANAIKFTTKGFVEYGYTIEVGKSVTIFVSDSGVGIDSESFDFIFDRFWQAKDMDVKRGGTGLGLAITKAYVELLGGHIQVESVIDQGTRFSFTIPLVLK